MTTTENIAVDIRPDVKAFQDALAEYVAAIASICADFERIFTAAGREWPHRSAMHTAYRAKTRRRNRRR